MTAVERADVHRRVTRYTLALNYLPLTQIAVGAAIIAAWARSPSAVVLWSAAWLYLLPPLACRAAFFAFGRPYGRALTQEAKAYKVWWFTHQWQAVFNRIPWIEELLRLVPGLYASWIFLWGGRASPFVYWAPGSFVVDRPLVIIESGAVLGIGAGIVGHVATIAKDGSYRIDIAASRIGRNAMMGARSGIAAGAEIAADHMLPAGHNVRPFTRWPGREKIGGPITESVTL